MPLDRSVICQFRFICTERWDGLTPIDGDLKKRFCRVCETPVYLTSSYDELATNIAAQRCVAIFLPSPDDMEMATMGMVFPEGDVFDSAFFVPVEELELALPTQNALKAGNLKCIADVVGHTNAQLAKGFSISGSQLEEICEALASYGLTTGMKIDGWVSPFPK